MTCTNIVEVITIAEDNTDKCVAWEVFRVKGHRNVRATHERSLEFTREGFLTERGDCIVGISSTKALKDFNEKFKELVRRSSALVLTLIVGGDGSYDIVLSKGDEGLTYSDPIKVIIRKSNYVSGNTAAIRSNKAARDLNRDLINYMRNDGAEAVVTMLVIDLNCFWSSPLTPHFPQHHTDLT